MNITIGDYKDLSNYDSEQYLKINSCGFQSFASRHVSVSRSRGRVDYHILYIKSGSCRIRHNDMDIIAHSGDFVFYLPHEKQFYTFNYPNESYWLHVAGTAMPQIVQSLDIKSGFFHTDNHESVNLIFNRMIYLNSLTSTYQTLLANAEVLNLIHTLFSPHSTFTHEMILDAVKYINLNWQNNITAEFLASRASISQSRFLHLFKEYTGEGVTRYLSLLKITKTKELLSGTDMKITDIAAYAGYSDSLYFSRIFKKYTNLSPSEYRKLYRPE